PAKRRDYTTLPRSVNTLFGLREVDWRATAAKAPPFPRLARWPLLEFVRRAGARPVLARPRGLSSPVPRSVLIVKLAAIGDVVMALPMVTALRAQEPATRITWLCGMTVAPLLECVDGIDELVAVDDVAVLSGNQARKAHAVMGGWSALSRRRFDLVLTAHS